MSHRGCRRNEIRSQPILCAVKSSSCPPRSLELVALPSSRRIPAVLVCRTLPSAPPHAGAGGAHNWAMSDGISWNICRGKATSAVCKVMYRPWLTTLAPIFISFSRKLVRDYGSASRGHRQVSHEGGISLFATWKNKMARTLIGLFTTFFLILFACYICVLQGWLQPSIKDVHDCLLVRERVPLDGYSYRHCTFRNVTFVMSGTAPAQVSTFASPMEGNDP